MRKTVRGFAAAIGVSDRMVPKGERGGENITPRPGNQAMLDTVPARSGPEVPERFAQLMTAEAFSAWWVVGRPACHVLGGEPAGGEVGGGCLVGA